MSAHCLSKMVKFAKKSESYWIEHAKLNFAIDVHDLMRSKGISKATVAEKLKTSASYVTKVLRGDTNVTIETMVKLVRAVDGQLHIKVSDANNEVHWIEAVRNGLEAPVGRWPGASWLAKERQVNDAVNVKEAENAAEPLAA